MILRNDLVVAMCFMTNGLKDVADNVKMLPQVSAQKNSECCDNRCVPQGQKCCPINFERNMFCPEDHDCCNEICCSSQPEMNSACCGTKYGKPSCLKAGDFCCDSEYSNPPYAFACLGANCCQRNVHTLDKVCCGGGCHGNGGLYCEQDDHI